jgi:hypothetical protein
MGSIGSESAAVVLRPTLSPGVRKPTSLLSPALDVLMIGGASLLLFVFAYFGVDKSANISQVSWAAFYLAFAVNNPHFMASYLLLYRDKRRELFSNKRYFWAAFVAPTLVLGYMVACIALESPKYLSYAVNFMYFTVGWHYIKQIYGTMVVTAARRGYYFTVSESRMLKANLFPVWFMSFINGNLGIRELMHYGIGYHTFDIPPVLQYVNYGLLAVSLVGVSYIIGRKWLKDGKLPGWPAIVSFAAIYVWYLPPLYHAAFWYMIPFFHSLQYLLFVITMKRNQYTVEGAAQTSDPVAQRQYFASQFWGFIALILVTGYLTFDGIPYFLDQILPYNQKIFGNQLNMFVFITFINIHHYFIDNVIWRRDNPALKVYLTVA